MSANIWSDANRRWWDERVPVHLRSASYDVEGFLAGNSALMPVEIAEVGRVIGRSLAHLQCQFGLDTLSWARLGADVVGLDFSGEAVRAARSISANVGLQSEFVEANVYDAAAALGGRTFDIVYTGKGSLNWLADMDAWAAVVARLLAPGGFLYLYEFHRFGEMFDDGAGEDLRLRYPYFPRAEPVYVNAPGSYTDRAVKTVHDDCYEWPHSMGEIVSALAANGLAIEFLHEFDYLVWKGMECMVPGELPNTWVLPQHRESVPLMYSIRARRSP